MKLSILIPALKARRALRCPLEAKLQKQTRAHSQVEVHVEEDDGQLTSGEKRNRLISGSSGEYFCFVDDDDMVADDYVDRLLDGCHSGADVVSFWLKRIGPDRSPAIHEFSIRFPDRQNRPGGHIGMAANHLCAWRREIGTAVAFPPHLGYGDDLFWYKPLLASGLVRAEKHIPAVLYTYRYDATITVNQRADVRRATCKWAGEGIECFRRDGEIFIALQNIGMTAKQEIIATRHRADRRVHWLRRDESERFHICKVV